MFTLVSTGLINQTGDRSSRLPEPRRGVGQEKGREGGEETATNMKIYLNIHSPATKEGMLVFSSVRRCFQIHAEVIHHGVKKKNPKGWT